MGRVYERDLELEHSALWCDWARAIERDHVGLALVMAERGVRDERVNGRGPNDPVLVPLWRDPGELGIDIESYEPRSVVGRHALF